MGPFGGIPKHSEWEVIPKPFRMVSYAEASPNGKAVPNEWLFRVERYSECSHNRENAKPNGGDLVGF